MKEYLLHFKNISSIFSILSSTHPKNILFQHVRLSSSEVRHRQMILHTKEEEKRYQKVNQSELLSVNEDMKKIKRNW